LDEKQRNNERRNVRKGSLLKQNIFAHPKGYALGERKIHPRKSEKME
jgi:hypothetical protein